MPDTFAMALILSWELSKNIVDHWMFQMKLEWWTPTKRLCGQSDLFYCVMHFQILDKAFFCKFFFSCLEYYQIFLSLCNSLLYSCNLGFKSRKFIFFVLHCFSKLLSLYCEICLTEANLGIDLCPGSSFGTITAIHYSYYT